MHLTRVKCELCRAPVRCAQTPFGRRIQLDWEPTPDGLYTLEIDVIAHYVGSDQPNDGPRYSVHRMTCRYR